MGNNYAALSTSEQEDFIRRTRLSRGKSSVEVERSCILRKPIHSEAVISLAVIRPGMVISGGRDNLIALHNIDTGECVQKWSGHQKEVTKLIYRNSVGHHLILSGSRDTTIKLWQFNSKHSLMTLTGHELSVTGIDLLDNNSLCSGSRDNTLRIWDLESGKCVTIKKHPRNLVTHLTRSKDGTFLAQSSEDKEIKLWDARDLSLIHQFPKKRHIQMHCDLLPDNNYCLSCSNGYNGDGGEISLWDVRQRRLLREFKGHEGTVHCAIFVPQQVTCKHLMLSVSADHSARIWDLEQGGCLWSEYVPSGGDLLSCVTFNDGSIVVCGLNACLCQMKLVGKAGRPYLHNISMQVQPSTSQSAHLISE